jgi:hypothetical protein
LKRSLTETNKLQRLQKHHTPGDLADSTAVDVFDAERDGGVQTIVNQSDELAETGLSDNTDAESWQGLSDSEFEDLDRVLSRATSIANSRPEEEAANQSTKTFQAGIADDKEVQSAQEPSTTTVPNSDEDLDAIAEIYVIKDLGSEPKKQDLVQNRDAADAMDVTLDSVVPPTRPDLADALSDSSGTQLTSAENQRLPKDKPPNHEKNAGAGLSSHHKHSPSRQISDPGRKRALFGHVTTIGPQGGKPNDESDAAFSTVHSLVELHGLPTNSPTDDRRVQCYTSYKASMYNDNAGLGNLTASNQSIINPTEPQPGTFEESKKPDLVEASPKKRVRQGKRSIILRKGLCANSSRLSDRNLR